MTTPLTSTPATPPATPPATAPASTAPASAGSAGGGGRASALTSDFETFLQMLTAQARYQDPLEPIDSTEYAAQLAQFSMVEQQVQTNDTLAALSTMLGVSNMASLAGWVGMEARAAMPAYFDGSPITIDPQMPATADQAVLVVRDASGAEVQRRPIPVSDDAFQWSGTESDGSPMAEGVYSFAVETFAGGDLLQSDTPEIYARITEAQTRNGQVMLIMPGGQSIASSDITALREPATASAI